jgi:hypothetical protein
MASKLGRRTVYLGTIVGAIALVAGFALAAQFVNTPVSANQNGFSASLGNTVWQAATPSLAPGTSSGTCSANTMNTPNSPATGSFTVAPGGSVTQPYYFGMNATSNLCSSNDFAEAWTFSISLSAGSWTNTFLIYAQWTQSASPMSTVVADTISMTVSSGTGTASITLVLVVDFGCNAPPTDISSLNVVVTGSA